MEVSIAALNTGLKSSPTPEPKRDLHTIKDVCMGARISHATTWRLIQRGVLETVKVGRRRLVTDPSYQRLIATGAP
jgi:hypothetical protein